MKGMTSVVSRLAVLALMPGLAWASGFTNRHVLIVGIDGLMPSAIAPAAATNLQQLATTGAASWDAIAGGLTGTATLQPTLSGPGWGSILTGVWSNRHQISNNAFTGYDSTNYPHFFRRIKEANPSAYLSSIVEWAPIDTALVGPAAAYTDFRQTATDGATTDLVAKASAHLASVDPDVLFLHFDAVDYAGHASGYSTSSAPYLAAVKRVDDGVGQVLAAVRARPNYTNESWLILAVTDHGGSGSSHGGQSVAERTIFVFAAGPGIPPRFMSPGPGHTCIPPTTLAWLGVPVSNAWNWVDTPFGLTDTPLTNRLEVYLPLDGDLAAGAPATVAASVYSGVPRYIAGLIGQAANFSNNAAAGQPSDWAATLGNLDAIYSNAFSASLWIRTPMSTDGALLGNKNWTAGGNPGWVISTLDGKNVNWNATGGTRRDIDLNPPLSDGQWHLVTVTADRDLGRVVVYLDGTARATNNILPAGAALVAGLPTLLGSSGNGTYAGRADVDEVGIWSRILYPAEVSDLNARGRAGSTIPAVYTPPPLIVQQPASVTATEGFDAAFTVGAFGASLNYQWRRAGSDLAGARASSLVFTNVTGVETGTYDVVVTNIYGAATSAVATLSFTPRPYTSLGDALLAHYPFDGTFEDRSGHGWHGSPVGSPGFVTGKLGSGALQFTTRADGSEISYVTLGTNLALALGTNSFATAFWISCTNVIGDPAVLGNKAWDSGNNTGFVVAALSGGTFKHNVRFATGSRVDGSGGAIGDGNWHHIAISYDRSAGVAALYLDGVLQASNSLAGTGGSVDSGLPLNVGQDGTGAYNYGGAAGIVNGRIDDLAIWLRALTPSDVQTLVLEGRDGRTFDPPPALRAVPAGGVLNMSWDVPGFRLQATTNLFTPLWITVGGPTNPISVPADGEAIRYYRIAR